MSHAVVTGVHHAKHDDHDDAYGQMDWTFWHTGKRRYMQRELKAQNGVVSRHQRRVRDDLQLCGIDAKVWRPSDEKEIIATFSGAPPFETGSIVGHTPDEEPA